MLGCPVFLAGAVLFSLIIIACASFYEIMSPDLFWHLRMGHDLLYSGLSPFRDHYSFTHLDQAIQNVAWPYQLLVTVFSSVFGEFMGINILRLVLFTVPLALLLILFRRLAIAGLVQAVVLMFYLCVVIFHTEPRPDLGSYTFTLISLWFMFRLRERLDLRNIIGFAFLLVLWSNYHVSSVFGFVIAGGLLMERAIDNGMKRDKAWEWREFLIAAVILVVAGFINFDLAHPLLAQAKVGENWSKYITEYDRRSFADEELYLQIFWVLLAFSLAYHGWKRAWSAVVIIAVLAFRTWSLSKLFPHLVVVNLVFVALALNGAWLWTIGRPGLMRVFVPLAIGTVGLVAGGQALFQGIIKPIHPITGDVHRWLTSVELADHIKSRGLKGNVLNEYSDGGYLLYRFAPELKVFIDGRTSILYPIDFMDLFGRLSISPALLREEALKRQVDFVVARVSKRDELFDSAISSGLFYVEYMGERWALLGRSGAFKVSSQLFVHPECLDAADAPVLQKEAVEAKAQLPATSPLRRGIEMSVASLTNPQAMNEVTVESAHALREPHLARWIAQLVHRSGDSKKAMDILLQQKDRTAGDQLTWAEWDCAAFACANAEALLHTLKASFTAEELTRVLALLEKISAQGPLRHFPSERMERIKKRLADRRGEGQTVPDWCALKRERRAGS